MNSPGTKQFEKLKFEVSEDEDKWLYFVTVSLIYLLIRSHILDFYEYFVTTLKVSKLHVSLIALIALLFLN